MLQLDIVAEFEIDKEAIEKTDQTNEEYNCKTSGGAAHRGALGPFGLLVLANDGLSEYTPIYFYVVKGNDGNLKTSFCSDQSRYILVYFCFELVVVRGVSIEFDSFFKRKKFEQIKNNWFISLVNS